MSPLFHIPQEHDFRAIEHVSEIIVWVDILNDKHVQVFHIAIICCNGTNFKYSTFQELDLLTSTEQTI